jgi:hypothetical protein
MFLRGFRELGVQRLISNTPTAHIRSMAMGLVEVAGNVEPRSLVIAPFSGKACAYWQVEVAVKNRDSWRIVHHNASGSPFFLRDDTGLAMIYPLGADCRLQFGVSEECHGLSLPEPYSDYLSDQHLAMRHLWQLDTMRFRERILEEDARVFVLGTAVPKPEVHTIGEGDEFVKTGTDGDAWSEQVRHRTQETVALVRQGENQKVFIISQQSERDLAMQVGLTAGCTSRAAAARGRVTRVPAGGAALAKRITRPALGARSFRQEAV